MGKINKKYKIARNNHKGEYYKGFTLIELLAIIVILAIISAITVPIVLNIIENAKKGTVQNSAYGYKDAINKYYFSALLDGNEVYLDGTYTKDQLKGMDLSISGQEPAGNSWVTIENSNVKTGCLQFDEYKVDIIDENVGDAEIGECNYIKTKYNLTLVTTGSGLYKSEIEPNRFVYRGTDTETNNRIILKENGTEVLYRIVSFEPDGAIKVIRNESIGMYAWDEANNRNSTTDTYCTRAQQNGCNVWGNQSNTLYNGNSLGDDFKYYFYNTSPTELISSNYGTVTKDATLNTYLNGEWLNSVNLSEYIENHSFNVGGVYAGAYVYYKDLLNERKNEASYTWTGKVGLLTLTEFVEASIDKKCTGVFYGQNNPYPCNKSNYNNKDYYQWSLSPYVAPSDITWSIGSAGFSKLNPSAVTRDVRPVFYLKSNTNLTGEGTTASPYRVVGM